MRVASARATEHVAALELLFRCWPPAAALDAVRGAAEMLAADPDGSVRLLVARRDGVIVGAALAEKLPGATGVIWPPCAAPEMPDPHHIEDLLTREAMAWLRRLGVNVAQAVLPIEDAALAAPLLRGGFARVTELLTLEVRPRPERVGGEFQTYADCPPAEFHEALLRGFEGGDDFPELEGRRSLRDTLHGYRAHGFDATRWWLRREAGRAAGVLILSETEPGNTWDLAFVGVVPEARRRGHGRALVLKAIAEAHAAGVEALLVSVDARNAPAIELYRGAGFDEIERRDVYLCVE